MDTPAAEAFQVTHMAIWNEKDRQKRDQLIDTVYSDAIAMYDNDFVLRGKTQVSDFIDKVQADPEFDFRAAKPIEFRQNGGRLFWHIQTSQGLLNGMDFFVLENGKVAQLYVFMEPAR